MYVEGEVSHLVIKAEWGFVLVVLLFAVCFVSINGQFLYQNHTYSTLITFWFNIHVSIYHYIIIGGVHIGFSNHIELVTVGWGGRVVARVVPGSIPGSVLGNYQMNYFFCAQSVTLESTQPVTEMSTKEFPWG
jgi:hypothetical protein